MEIRKEEHCPVCGFQFYKEYGFLPWKDDMPSDEMCPSCGFQFGLDDFDQESGTYYKKEVKYTKWRNEWIKEGFKWNSSNLSDFSQEPKKQLSNIGINLEL